MRFLLVIITFFLTFPTYSFAQSDSLVYQLQRNKINGMLDSRSLKFGQYTESLSSRTGIFGLKTKRDMQKSIDILSEIIETDNAILKETKTLLDYKTFEQERVVSKSQESEIKNLAYMRTINKLESEKEKLQAQLLSAEKGDGFYQNIILILSILLLIMAVFTFRQIYSNRKFKPQKS